MNILPPIFQYNSMFTEEESKQLSKQRIIQKNLVHFQGFPDRLYSKELLCSNEYFGQYGEISKIILTNKIDIKSKKKLNSAYLTFSTPEQAAYTILSVDSIKIDDQLVRAFFGTTKYCNHFLNNFNCFNSQKCMFLHHLADEKDIIVENYKFGYSEHIKLAKKIIGFGSIQSQLYVMKNAIKTTPALPSIVTIYHKEHILIKTQNHRRKSSKDSSNSSNDNTNSDSNIITRSASNNSNRNISPDNKNNEAKEIIISKNNLNIINDNDLLKSRNKSRFSFVNINNNLLNNRNNNNNLYNVSKDLFDELLLRFSFFIQFNDNIPLKKVEYDFCNNIYIKTKNEELRKIIENIF